MNSKSFLGSAVEIGTLIVNFAVGTAAVGLSGTVDLKSWVKMEWNKSFIGTNLVVFSFI